MPDSEATKGDTGAKAIVAMPTLGLVNSDDDVNNDDIHEANKKTTKTCCGCRLPPLRHVITVAACLIIEASLGVTYTIGNMVPYVTSYLRNVTEETSVGYGQMIWVGNSLWLTFAIVIPLAGLVESRMNGRLFIFLGICFNAAAFFGTYWALQTSFVVLIIIFGVLQGFAQAILYPGCFSVALRWFPHNKGLVGGITMSGYGGGAFIWNQVVTRWINPDNLQPDLALGEDLYFTQKELLDRVPTCYLLLGGLLTATQLLCLVSLAIPPVGHGEGLLLGTAETDIEASTDEAEKPLLRADITAVEPGTEVTEKSVLDVDEREIEAGTKVTEESHIHTDETYVEESIEDTEKPLIETDETDVQGNTEVIQKSPMDSEEADAEANTKDIEKPLMDTDETDIEADNKVIEKPLNNTDETDIVTGIGVIQKSFNDTDETDIATGTEVIQKSFNDTDETGVEEGTEVTEKSLLSTDVGTGAKGIERPLLDTDEINTDKNCTVKIHLEEDTDHADKPALSTDETEIETGTDVIKLGTDQADVETVGEDTEKSFPCTHGTDTEADTVDSLSLPLGTADTNVAATSKENDTIALGTPDADSATLLKSAETDVEADTADNDRGAPEIANTEESPRPSDSERLRETNVDDAAKSQYSEPRLDQIETEAEEYADNRARLLHNENRFGQTEIKTGAAGTGSRDSDNLLDQTETKLDDAAESPPSEKLMDQPESPICQLDRTANCEVRHINNVTTDEGPHQSVTPKTNGLTTPKIVVAQNRRNDESLNYAPLQVVKSGIVWLLWLNNFTIDVGFIFIVTFYKAYGQTFIKNDHLLSLVGSFAAVFNAAVRPFWGLLADRIGFFPTLLMAEIILVVTSGTFVTCELSGSSAMFFAWVCAMYIAFGGIFCLTPALVSEIFGNRYLIFSLGVVSSSAIVSCVGTVPLAEALLRKFGWKSIFAAASGGVACGATVLFSSLILCGHHLALPDKLRLRCRRQGRATTKTTQG